MDNLNPDAGQDNLDPNEGQQQQAPTTWKEHLSDDVRNRPLVQKFGDDVNGLNESFKSYANLEKLLGHEKVPIPQGDDDSEGWERFSKAMGIPDKAEAYGLADPEIPAELEGMVEVNKQEFAEMCHGLKLTPNQTKALYNQFVQGEISFAQQHLEDTKTQMTKTVNELRGKWGDAYDTNVHLGQMVINKFSGGDKETEAFLTTALAQDPRGVEFLAKVGNNFAENKIGAFSATRFSLAPEQAQGEIDKIMANPNHPYLNEKATKQEHDEAVDYVNRLYSIANKKPY